ncbi:MAG: rRNA maturation RNase YbeY [Eubacteriales bacterium]
MPVLVSNLQEKVAVDDEFSSFLSVVAGEVLKEEGYDMESEVGLVFVDEDYIHGLNLQYRGVDAPTDVLSFAMQEGEQMPDEGDENILGDVVISLQTALRQAGEYGHSFRREAAYLTVHGVLHLLGYDHQNEQDQAEMRRKEEGILVRLGMSRV